MPVATSCHICIDVIVAMVFLAKRPCDVVHPGGMSMVMYSESTPCMDLPISAKPSGGFCFCMLGLPNGVFVLWLGMFDELTMWVELVGFEHSIMWVTGKEHQRQALLLLLQFCFPHSFRLHGLRGSRWSYIYPVWWVIGEDFFIGKWCQWLHGLAKLAHTSCKLVGMAGLGQLGFFLPELQGLGVGQHLLGLLYPIILAAKIPSAKGKKSISLYTVGHRLCRVVISG